MEADSSVYMSMYVTYAEIVHVHGRRKQGRRGSLSCLTFLEKWPLNHTLRREETRQVPTEHAECFLSIVRHTNTEQRYH